MIVSTFNILALLGATIFLGYIGLYIFSRTKIPDVIWLLFLGFAAAQTGFVNREMFLSVSPMLAALALLIILFDAGMKMRFYEMLRDLSRATLLSILGVALSLAAVALFSFYVFRFDFYTSVLLGAMLGGTSSPIVISIVSGLKVEEKVKSILNLESIISDPLIIVIALASVQAALAQTISTASVANSIFGAFSIGACSGL